MKEDIIVLENFIPEFYQKNIENVFNTLPWYFDNNTSGIDPIPTFGLPNPINKNDQSGFSHIMFDEGKSVSNYFYLIEPMIYRIMEFIKDGVDLIRVRGGMTTSSGEYSVINGHVDYYIPNTTALYYVNESDGDTIFYKEKYLGEEQKELNFLKSISPKKGSLVLFDGLRYHSTTKPKKSSSRMTININIANTIF